MLSEKLRTNITETINKIERGDFDYDNVCSLFMNLRNALEKEDKKGYEILYDIFNTVAHHDRDRGMIFEYAKKIINDFIHAIKSGGSVTAETVSPNLDQALERIFELLSIPYNKALFEEQIPKIKHLMYNNILKGTKLVIQNDDIDSCSIVKLEDGFLYVEFKMKPFSHTNNGLTISGSPTMRFRLM